MYRTKITPGILIIEDYPVGIFIFIVLVLASMVLAFGSNTDYFALFMTGLVPVIFFCLY